MTTNFFKIDPNATETQRIDLPVDSIVYMGIKTDAVSGLYLPIVFLKQTLEPAKQMWQNAEPPTVNGTYSGYLPYLRNDMTFAKYWLGYVPFESTFTAEIHGKTLVLSGDEALSATRRTYEKADGSSFIVDTIDLGMGDTKAIQFDCWLAESGSQTTGFGSNMTRFVVVRDSQGNRTGGYSKYYKRRAVKVGRVMRYYASYQLYPFTEFGTIPFTPVENTTEGYSANGTVYVDPVYEVDPSEATKVGDDETVSITDYFYYAPATPITFPMQITADERSYSFTQI